MPVIQARAVSKRFLLTHNGSSELKVRFLSWLHPQRRHTTEEFWALRDVSLSIDHGEAVGLLGPNGSGKSTLLKLIAAIHRPSAGELLVARRARIASMIELGVGFHPELTGRENVFLNASIHGLNRADIERIYDAIVEYSGLEHFIDVPIKNYSSGMYMRLGFAIAANLNPDILLLDEIFAVGDADFQRRCTATVNAFLESGKTLVFVSHAPAAVRSICRRVCVLDRGRLAFDGPVEDGLTFYDRAGATAAIAPPAEAPVEPVGTHAVPSAVEREWWLDLLRREGLQPFHSMADLGQESMTGPNVLRDFSQSGRYQAVDWRHLPADGAPEFDFVVADSLLPRLPFNDVARCLTTVVRHLAPSGRFYASGFENPAVDSFEPIARSNDVVTYADREPYHYPLEWLATVCQAIGARIERVSANNHPSGETVWVITRE